MALFNVFLDSVCQTVAVSEHECWPLQALLLDVLQRAAGHVCFCQEMSEPFELTRALETQRIPLPPVWIGQLS